MRWQIARVESRLSRQGDGTPAAIVWKTPQPTVPRAVKSVARIVLLAMLAVTALATVLSLFGRHAWLLDLLTFGRQHLAVLSIALAIWALYTRQPRVGLIALLCVAINWAPLVASQRASMNA